MNYSHALKIVHHHAFKTAGSTMMWILEKNFPGQVLYIEGEKNAGEKCRRRLHCDDLPPHLESGAYQAVSSHLLMVPDMGENVGEVHFSLLRDPLERTLSAYHFLKRGGEIDSDMTLAEFCQSNFQAGNFQLHHSSLREDKTPIDDWSINDKIYQKIDSGEIFFGLVEYFDHTMLLLEELLKRHGVKFDGAYTQDFNRTAGKTGRQWQMNDADRKILLEKNARDIELYAYVRHKFLERFHARFGDKDLEDFARRCYRLRRKFNRKKRKPRPVIVPDASQWVHVDF
ncbi:MAG: sulfotransferase family protein [Desulfuromonadales bacterium]|nr:sulfotransferase family protein [Desulfuromonadales bacterium]